jgi:Fe-S-cluster containining protein
MNPQNPNCAECRGACCESLVIPLVTEQEDFARWLGYHGRMEGKGMRRVVEIEAPCKYLEAGQCGIYDMRPDFCRDFPVGGPSCLETIRRRRVTPN